VLAPFSVGTATWVAHEDLYLALRRADTHVPRTGRPLRLRATSEPEGSPRSSSWNVWAEYLTAPPGGVPLGRPQPSNVWRATRGDVATVPAGRTGAHAFSLTSLARAVLQRRSKLDAPRPVVGFFCVPGGFAVAHNLELWIRRLLRRPSLTWRGAAAAAAPGGSTGASLRPAWWRDAV
jgi:hypothetical protein